MTDARQQMLDYIASRLAESSAGQPTTIHFWDGNHGNDYAATLHSDPDLLRLMQQNGYPIYMVEEASSPSLLNDYFEGIRRNLPPDQLPDINLENTRLDVYQTLARQGVPVIFPDAREENINHFFSGLSEDQKRAIAHGTEFIYNMANAGYDCLRQVQQMQSLPAATPEAEALLNSTMKEYLDVGLGTQTNDPMYDQKNAENAQEMMAAYPAEAQGKPIILVGMYGLAHYTKANDLDERLKGSSRPVNIAFLEGDGSFPQQKNDDTPQIPDAVYNMRDHTFTVLNTPEAIATYLGTATSPIGQDGVSTQTPTTISEACEAALDSIEPFSLSPPTAASMPSRGR